LHPTDKVTTNVTSSFISICLHDLCSWKKGWDWEHKMAGKW